MKAELSEAPRAAPGGVAGRQLRLPRCKLTMIPFSLRFGDITLAAVLEKRLEGIGGMMVKFAVSIWLGYGVYLAKYYTRLDVSERVL